MYPYSRDHYFTIIYDFAIDCALDVYKLKDSAVVVIAVCEKKPNEELNMKRNIEVFKKIVPTIAKVAYKAVLLVVTQPIDVMSYITWKLSKFPPSRVLGTGTLLDTCRFQDLLSRKLGLARTSISCMSIGAQGDTSGTRPTSWLILPIIKSFFFFLDAMVFRKILPQSLQ